MKMFNKIHLKNVFVHKDLMLDLKEGLTNISGLNGTGKTLVIEMAHFALWGSEALRGAVSGYKGAKVQLWFEVKGRSYSITRSTSNADLVDDNGNPLATGTKPVNAKVRELFGYGYDVFKIANSAKQSEILALSNMKPTERKKLVDETIGLSKIEDLAKWVAERHTAANAEVKAVASVLRAPDPLPAAPASFDPAAYDTAKQQLNVYIQEKPHAISPAEVTPHPQFLKLQDLVDQQALRTARLQEVRGLELAINGIPELGVAPSLHPDDSKYEEYKESTRKYLEASGQVDMITKALTTMNADSSYTNEQLEEIRAAHSMAKRWAEKQKLVGAQVEHNCPACAHKWFTGDPRIADYADVPEECPVPALSLTLVSQEQKVNDYQETRKTLLQGQAKAIEERDGNKSYAIEISKIEAARRDMSRYEGQVKSAETRAELVAKRAAVEVPEDVSALISEIQKQQEAYDKFVIQHERYLTADARLKGIPENIAEIVEQMGQLRDAWIRYRALQESWNKAQEVYELNLSRLQELEAKAESWANVKKAIVELRARIKGYLLPSLNDVASRLISLMSNRWLNKVEITEDFEIFTDGKPLEVLSGAGQTLTNLAIRIGLGQVLTNSVFSSITLDEADASVDVEKAPMISAALRALTKTIKQIIVISHKQGLEADQYVKF